MARKKKVEKPERIVRIRVTQIRSAIGHPVKQKATLRALGLHRINHSVEHNSTRAILGMIARVPHLVRVEEVQ